MLSLFLAALTGAWAQTVSNVKIAASETDIPCKTTAPTTTPQRTITVNYDISAPGPVSPNARIIITNVAGDSIYGSRVLTGTELAAGTGKSVNIDMTDAAGVSANNARVLRFQQDLGVAADNYSDYGPNALSTPFYILLRAGITDLVANSVCENDPISVRILGTNLAVYAPYTVTYQFMYGLVPGPNQTATATNGAPGELTFTTSPSLVGVTGVRVSALLSQKTLPNSLTPCTVNVPFIGYLEAALAISQRPTISGAIAPTPVCVGQDVPVTLQGLLGSSTPTIGQQTITYTINGGAPQTLTFTVPGAGVNQNFIVNIPGVPVGGTIVITSITGSPVSCPRLTSPLPITLTPEVHALPTAVLSTPNSAPFCDTEMGNTVPITVTGLGVISYNFVANGTISAISGGPVAAGSGTLNVTHTDGVGTKTNTFTVSDTYNGITCVSNPATTITIVLVETPTSTLTASQTDVCPNTEVSLNPGCSVPTSLVQWTTSNPTSPGGFTVTPNAPDQTYTYTSTCNNEGCIGAASAPVDVRTHRLLADIVKISHPGNAVNTPGTISGNILADLKPTNSIVNNDASRTWNIIARPCYAPVGSIALALLPGSPIVFGAVDNYAPHALFANVSATEFYSQATTNYGAGMPTFKNGTYTLLLEGRMNLVAGEIPKDRYANKLSGGQLLSTRTIQFTVSGSTPGARAGAEEVVNADWVNIVQNPISEEITLRISGKVGDEVKLNLVNLQGQSIHESGVKLESSSELTKINVRHINTGFYILKAVNGDQVKTIKVLKAQ